MLGWTGMRGVVSLAAALAIPLTLANGEPFPHRSLILFITFVVILLTLLVQGLTLPIIIKRMHFFDESIMGENEASTRLKMKQGLKQHIYQELKSKHENGEHDQPVIEKIMKQWEDRAKITDDSQMSKQTKAIFVALLESQRAYLTELNKDPKIDEEIIRKQLYQIDLEEERLKII
jgi:NhaP-type Na+/H+ or K+/H+ antiporter